MTRTARIIPTEIESRTIYPLLAKPTSRTLISNAMLEKAETLFYLGYLAKKRNDLDTLHRWQTIAKETMSPDLISIRNLLKIE
jgi:hypothetical protein